MSRLADEDLDRASIQLADRFWELMPEKPDVGDVVELAGRLFCAVVGAANVTLPTAVGAVQFMWMRMHGKPGDRG